MPTKIKRHLRRLAATLLLCGSIAAVTRAVPSDALCALGERAALLAAGLHRPSAGAELLSGHLTRASAAAASTTASTASLPSLGEGQTAAVTAAPTVPARQTGGGNILTQQMSAGSTFVQGVAIRNKSGQEVDIADRLRHRPALDLSVTDAPQVLIMHTHTTECYMSYDAGYYNPDDPTRSTDPARNMIAVGERVAAQLTAAGIGVIHDTAIYDQPYTGAYVHSQAGVKAYLQRYPSLRVVLDLHRDAVYKDSTTYLKPTVTIDGRPAAQVMVVVGMKNTAKQPNGHTAENLSFAAHLQQRLHQTHPGLARPLLLAKAQYNQQLTNGSLLIEIGGHANTLDEACYSGDLLGGVLANVLHDLGA